MKEYIAVPYKDGTIFQHFGQASGFKIYETNEGKILKAEEIVPQSGGHGAVADFLIVSGVTTVICGGIGKGAMDALQAKGIQLLSGVVGNADEKIKEYLMGVLVFETGTTCKKHGEEHSCGGDHGEHKDH